VAAKGCSEMITPDEKELEKKSEAVRLMTSATGGGCGLGDIYILHEESIKDVLKGDKIRNRDVEHSITQSFRNVIGVYYLRIRRYLGLSYVNHINL
jgi:hypothetical protein